MIPDPCLEECQADLEEYFAELELPAGDGLGDELGEVAVLLPPLPELE